MRKTGEMDREQLRIEQRDNERSRVRIHVLLRGQFDKERLSF